MNKLFPDIPLFVEVARHGSFTKAAEVLDIGISTVSRRIKLLETQLGLPLFFRDTHSVRLTDAGEQLLEHCEFIVGSADAALESVTRSVSHPSGRVRISMYPDIYYGPMRGGFTSFSEKWPEIDLTIHLADAPPDLLCEPYDVVFRVGPLPDSSMVAWNVLTISTSLYASPKLLEKCDEPKLPQDLLKMPCISLARTGNVWELHSNQQVSVLRITPRFLFSSAPLVLEYALGGFGVALMSDRLVTPHLNSGQLVRILPDWSGPVYDLLIVVSGKNVPRRVRVFVEYMREIFASLHGQQQ